MQVPAGVEIWVGDTLSDEQVKAKLNESKKSYNKPLQPTADGGR